MNRLLLIIDPQVDFISGTLPVPGAEGAMDNLARYIADNDGRYVHKVVTADRHPFNHCSFIENGGEWPRHCVHDTIGAAIWPPLFPALYETSGQVTFLYKGEKSDEEEYSILKNPVTREQLLAIIRDNNIDSIDICGLAGDVCVLTTLIDAIHLLPKEMLNVLPQFSPSIDGGTKLTEAIKDIGAVPEI